MLGFRGASRYYHERYRDGFALECRAMKKVRDEMGLTNVKLMVPFCRTVEEGRRVIAEMAKHGLKHGENGLEVYVMCEIPSNVILADEFARRLRRILDRLERPDAARPGRRPRLGDRRPPLRRAQPGGQDDDRAGHRDGTANGSQDRHLRPGAQRLPRVRPIPGRTRIDSISLNPDAVVKTTLKVLEMEQAIDRSGAAVPRRSTPPHTEPGSSRSAATVMEVVG